MRLKSIINNSYSHLSVAGGVILSLSLANTDAWAFAKISAAPTRQSRADTTSVSTTVQHYQLNQNNSSQPVASNSPLLPTAVNLVKEFEGFRATAYVDTNGLPVIGYGQTRINGQRVRLGQYITQAQASAELKQELYQIQKLVKSYVRVELNPHQLGALTSLVFNAGTVILTDSTLIRKLNLGDYAGAAKEFPRWNKANQGGRLVPFPGLTRRRLAEKQLFLTPYQQVASN